MLVINILSQACDFRSGTDGLEQGSVSGVEAWGAHAPVDKEMPHDSLFHPVRKFRPAQCKLRREARSELNIDSIAPRVAQDEDRRSGPDGNAVDTNRVRGVDATPGTVRSDRHWREETESFVPKLRLLRVVYLAYCQ